MISNKKRYSELSTQKAGIYFTTADLRDASRRFADATERYHKLQSNLVKEVIGIASKQGSANHVLGRY